MLGVFFGVCMSFFSSVVIAAGPELLLFEQKDCPYCDKWHAEIGPIYPLTSEAKQAPLRVVQIHDPLPKGLPLELAHIDITPTFVLINDGVEVDRLLGYTSSHFFWALLQQMLNKLPADARGD